jgi:sigma-B regulation protein RsbU (phosphoserine phosphatase)
VCGKSISAALFMSYVITLLKAFTERLYAESKSPVEAAELINRYLCKYHPKGDLGIRFVTMFLGVINTKTGCMDYVNAGHLPPFFATSQGALLRTGTTGPAIGISTELAFSRKSLRFDHNDLLFIVTDGVTEAKNSKEDLFTDARLAKIVQGHGNDPHRLIAAVNDEIAHYCAGCERSDDITMLALKRR